MNRLNRIYRALQELKQESLHKARNAMLIKGIKREMWSSPWNIITKPKKALPLTASRGVVDNQYQ